MWSRFDEMRKLDKCNEQQSKLKKRKGYQKSEKNSLKKRKRTLFSTSHLSKEIAAGSGCSFLAGKHDTNIISEFSTDDEEDNCPLEKDRDGKSIPTQSKCNSFEKQSEQPKKRASSSSSKYGGLSKPRRSGTKATFRSIVKLEDSTSLIKWSDSDSDHDIATINKEVPRESVTEQDCIGVFESPVKTLLKQPPSILDTENSPVSIEDCTLPSPLDIKEEKPRQEDDFIPKPTDSSKKKRFKDVKGGLVEQCKKVVSRERSDIAFWKHSLNAERSEVAVCVAKEDKSKLILRVEDIEHDFSLTMLKCCILRNNFATIYIVLPTNAIAEYKIEKENVLELYPPFRKVTVKGVAHPVLLCAYFLKMVPDSPEFHISQEYCELGKADSDSLGSHEASMTTSSGSSAMCRNESSQIPQSIATTFSECNISQPVNFCANIIKSNLTVRRSPPEFHANCDKSIVPYVIKTIKESRPDSSFELYLILKDRVGQVALLTLSLKDNETRELCCLSETNGVKLEFKHFFLRDIKSISYNQTVLSVLRCLKLEDSCLGDVCYMFSESEESTIALCKTDESSINESSEKFPSLLPNTYCQRISFYAYCVCIMPGIYVEDPSSCSSFSLFAVKSAVDYQENLSQTVASSKIEDSVLVCIAKLPTCYIPEIVTNCFLEKGKVFLFQDILETHEAKQFVLDSLSRVCLVQSESKAEEFSTDYTVLYGTKIVREEFLNTLVKKGFILNISKLSLEWEKKTVVFAEGTISGINDDSAVFWTVCGSCGLETKEPVTKANFFCDTCGKLVKSNFHVQLEVNLNCEDLPGVQITVKLLEKTIFEYLPLDISDDFNGYDTECIIGKKFGKKLCYIESQVNNFDEKTGQTSTTSVILKEVTVAEDMAEYLNL